MKFFVKTIFLFAFAVALSSCGGGSGGTTATGGGNGGGGGNGNGGGNGGTITPPATGGGGRPPHSAAINGLLPEMRADALSAEQNLGSVTQSSNVDEDGVTEDSVGVMLDNDDNPMFDAANNIMVENSGIGMTWQGTQNAPPEGYTLSADYMAFDGESFANKRRDYAEGDYYYASGYWFNGNDNFGGFVDASQYEDDLPLTGTADYEGNINGYYWRTEGTTDDGGVFSGSFNLRASISGDGNIQINGNSTIDHVETPENSIENPDILLSFENIDDNTGDGRDGGFTGGAITCDGCDTADGFESSWGGQFIGNRITTTGGFAPGATTGDWPVGFIGTFGFKGLVIASEDGGDNEVYDALGRIGSFHSDLCNAASYLSDRILQSGCGDTYDLAGLDAHRANIDDSIWGLTDEQRENALTNVQITMGGITQSRAGGDSIRVAKYSNDHPKFIVIDDSMLPIHPIVENTALSEVNTQIASGSIIKTDVLFFDRATFKDSTVDYTPGDFYFVSGFWYRDDTDFGVFADGPPANSTGSIAPQTVATYNGNFNGYYWSDNPLAISLLGVNGSLSGDVALTASFDSGITQMEGRVTIPRDGIERADGGVVSDFIPGSIPFDLNNIPDSNSDGSFTDGDISCGDACDSNWGGKFVGGAFDNRATPNVNTNGWPAGFVGTFGVSNAVGGEPPNHVQIDAIGYFGAIYDDLCALTDIVC